MKIKTLIIDDEPIALEKLRSYVNKIPALELSGAFNNGIDAIAHVAENDIDLIITDIYMPDLNGLEVVKSLSHKPMVIITTAYPEYAIEGYKVSAIDYILKPYGFYELNLAVAKAVEQIEYSRKQPECKAETVGDSLFIKVDHRYLRVELSDIRYIKGYGEYLKIYIEGKGNPMVTLSSFATIKEKLTDNFLQVHRSYIVNMNRIHSAERNRIVISDNEDIPVSDSYKANLAHFLASHSIGQKSR